MGLLTLEATGPDGEKLAMKAGDETGIAVGFDPEFECATFDSSSIDGEELETVVFEALGRIDAGWRSHLQRVD